MRNFRAKVIAVGEHAEQEFHAAAAHRYVAQFVADQQVRAIELSQEAIERVLLLLLLQAAHQLGHREEAYP
jgi:hypothetical protein